MRICSEAGCDRPIKSRGRCSMHYTQWLRANGPTCYIKGCNRGYFAAGLCSRHYMRQLKTGTTDDGKRARSPLSERLWRQVEIRGPNDCWPWTAASDVRGYGYLGRGGRNAGKILSHRAAWEVTYGPIPPGEGAHGTVVRHMCDNRKCCNPAHLVLGSQYENVRDMDERGRRRSVVKYGHEHPNAVLTLEEAKAIKFSDEPTWVLAKRFGVERHTVSNIRRGKTYKNITRDSVSP